MKGRPSDQLQEWVKLNHSTVLDRVTREVCRDDVPINKSREVAENVFQEFLYQLLNQKASLSRRLVACDDGLWIKPPRKDRRRRKLKPFTVAYVVKCCKHRARAQLAKEADEMTRIEEEWKTRLPLTEPDVVWREDDERMGGGTESADRVLARELARERKLLLARLRRNLESACEKLPENERAPLAVGVWKELTKEGHTRCPERVAFLQLIGCTEQDIARWRRVTAEKTQYSAPSHAKETLRRLLYEREISLRNLVKLAQVFRWYFSACE